MLKIQIKNESRSKTTNADGKTESLHVRVHNNGGLVQRITAFDKEF